MANTELPILREKDGHLYYVKGKFELLINSRGITVTVAELKQLSASTAQRFFHAHDLELPLTTPSEIFVPIVASFVQLAWLLHYFHKVDDKIVDRHNRRLERYKAYLKTGELPDSYIKVNAPSDVLLKKYSLKQGLQYRSSGQRGLVFDCLKELGSATIPELTAAVVKTGSLVTRQEPERIVRYYIILHLDKEVVEDGPAN